MSGVVGNTYSWSPTAGLSNPSIGDPIASPATTTLYTLTVTDASGCSEDGMVTVTVDDTSPTVAITNNTGSTTLTCTQLEINVTATGAIGYTWDNGLGNITSPSITAPGIYTVTGTGTNGCESSAQIEVIQDSGVDLLLVLAQPEICSGEMIDISVNSPNATDFNWTVIQNGVAGASDGTVINTASGASISQVLTLTGLMNGTVDYVVEPILGACLGESQTVSITVLSQESPQFTQPGPFCLNDVPAVLPSSSLEGIIGSWSPSIISTTSAGTSTYSFTPNLGQCAMAQTMDIVVNELPSVSFSGDSLVGCAPHTVILTTQSDFSTWTISNGVVLEGNEVTLILTSPGCYDVTLEIDENGCSNSLTIPSYVCIEEDPVAEFTVSPDLLTDEDALVLFTNLSSGASSFVWNFGDGNTSSYINPSHLYENTEDGALITLTAISDFGCTDQVQLTMEYDEQEIFYIPNTFTPDGDNFNQIFTPIFYSGFDPYNFEMLIFNRWGEIVFETHNPETGWDGSYGVNGTKAMDGAYTWKITYKSPKTDDRKVIVGQVTLMR
jgi:gliding motility-associated-like protein